MFSLRQFEIGTILHIRPYNACAFSGPIAVYTSVFFIYPLGQSSYFAPSFGIAAIFIGMLFLQEAHNWASFDNWCLDNSTTFHNWTLNPFHMIGEGTVTFRTLNPFHMIGVGGICGFLIHGGTVINTIYQDGQENAHSFSMLLHHANMRNAFGPIINTIYQDGQAYTTFRAFSVSSPSETYSMVTANRFWSQIFGVAFTRLMGSVISNKRWLHFFILYLHL